eukprot:1191950-Prorocentrum_minimum.AAC.1
MARTLYLVVITLLGIGCLSVSMLDRFQSLEYQAFRGYLFTGTSPCLPHIPVYWYVPLPSAYTCLLVRPPAFRGYLFTGMSPCLPRIPVYWYVPLPSANTCLLVRPPALKPSMRGAPPTAH